MTTSDRDGTPRRLARAEATARLGRLDPGWALDGEADAIVRTFPVKGFARAVYVANVAAFHADRQGHHPDIAFGVGYCRVRYATHDVGGLSAADFDAAAGLDRLLG